MIDSAGGDSRTSSGTDDDEEIEHYLDNVGFEYPLALSRLSGNNYRIRAGCEDMDQKDAEEGVEVTHPKYGRGYISNYCPHFGAEPDELTVDFYEAEQRTIPVYAVDRARKVTLADVSSDTNGFKVTIDDGYHTLTVRPDGCGGSFEVSLLSKGEERDTATLTLTSE